MNRPVNKRALLVHFLLPLLTSVFAGAITVAFGGTIIASDSSMTFRTNGNTTALVLDTNQNAQLIGKFTTYANTTTEGLGNPAIVKYGNIATQSAAATVLTYTVGAGNETLEVGAGLAVNNTGSCALQIELDYTDPKVNAAITTNLDLRRVVNTANLVYVLTANVVGTSYSAYSSMINAKAGSSVVVKITGTVTTATYDATAYLSRVN